MRYLIILVAMLFMPALALSDTIYVPDDYATIQGAIIAAVKGDTIIVKPGTYVENIDFLGKAITVMSEMGAQATLIDGNQSGSALKFKSGEKADSILNGFTITNGKGILYGGGVYCDNKSSPVIMNNIIMENNARSGGGIYCYLSSPIITNNTIRDNYVDSPGGDPDLKHGALGHKVLFGQVPERGAKTA